jgi:hypothetical protein
LKTFIEQHGHNNPRGDTHPKLCRWVCRQRYRYKLKAKGEKTALTDEHIAKLEEIGFKWEKVSGLEEKQRRKVSSDKKRNEKRKEKKQREKVDAETKEKGTSMPAKKKQKAKSSPPLSKGIKEKRAKKNSTEKQETSADSLNAPIAVVPLVSLTAAEVEGKFVLNELRRFL